MYVPERDDEHPRPFQKGVLLHPEHYFCGNVTQYTVKNSHFCCLKELGHAASLCNCSLMPPNEKKIGQRDMFLLLTSWEIRVGTFLGHEICSSRFGCA